MLADIYLAKSTFLRPRMDLHRHATFSCTMQRTWRQFRALFSGAGIRGRTLTAPQ